MTRWRTVRAAIASMAITTSLAACSALVRDGQYACTGSGRATDCPPDHSCRVDPRVPGELRCWSTPGPSDPPDDASTDASIDASTDASTDARVDASARDASDRDDATIAADAGYLACVSDGPCSIETQTGCPAGQACDWVATRRIGCRAIGTRRPYEECSAAAPCQIGLTCQGTRSGSRCAALCCEAGESCGDGERSCVALVLDSEIGPAACLEPPQCDPFDASACGPGEACDPDRFGARCEPPGSAAQGDVCSIDVRCAPGLVCGGEPQRCRALCRVGGEPGCIEGQRCLGLDPFSRAGGCIPGEL